MATILGAVVFSSYPSSADRSTPSNVQLEHLTTSKSDNGKSKMKTVGKKLYFNILTSFPVVIYISWFPAINTSSQRTGIQQLNACLSHDRPVQFSAKIRSRQAITMCVVQNLELRQQQQE